MPRANLNPQKILDQALYWVDAYGYESLSMACLAQAFHVAVPSLYKHVPSLAWIQSRIAEKGIQELSEVFQKAIYKQDQEAALRQLARKYRQYAIEHPGRYTAIQRAPSLHDANLQALSERILEPIYDLLKTYGRTGDQATHDIRLLRAALHGFVILEMTGGFGMTLNIETSFDHLIEMLDATFRNQTSN